MPYLARKSIPQDRVRTTFVVEHESGRIVATCWTWSEAVAERNRLNAMELYAECT